MECGLRRPEGKHPVHLGRQGLCRRGWVTILTRASVAVGQAGVSVPPPPHPHPDGAAVDLAPTHPASQARNQLKAQRALPTLGHLASLALTGSPVCHPMVIPRSLCFLCSESSCQWRWPPHGSHSPPSSWWQGLHTPTLRLTHRPWSLEEEAASERPPQLPSLLGEGAVMEWGCLSGRALTLPATCHRVL